MQTTIPLTQQFKVLVCPFCFAVFCPLLFGSSRCYCHTCVPCSGFFCLRLSGFWVTGGFFALCRNIWASVDPFFTPGSSVHTTLVLCASIKALLDSILRGVKRALLETYCLTIMNDIDH